MQLTQQEIVVLRKTFLFHRLSPAAYMKLSEQNLYGAFRAELRTGSQLEYLSSRKERYGPRRACRKENASKHVKITI